MADQSDGAVRLICKRDVIACPPGGPEVVHQIVNTGKTTMRYLALSTLAEVVACEYPDSRKVGIYAARAPAAASPRCSARRPWSTTTTASPF